MYIKMSDFLVWVGSLFRLGKVFARNGGDKLMHFEIVTDKDCVSLI